MISTARIAPSKGLTRLGAFIVWNWKHNQPLKGHASFINEMMDKVPKKKTLSLNFFVLYISLLFTHDN
jgi:hypothetical protein